MDKRSLAFLLNDEPLAEPRVSTPHNAPAPGTILQTTPLPPQCTTSLHNPVQPHQKNPLAFLQSASTAKPATHRAPKPAVSTGPLSDIPKVAASLLRRFDCPHCERLFKQKRDLLKHITCVHFKQKPFSCSECDMVFSHRGNLKQHFREVHARERPFKCKLCGSAFSRAGNLAGHRNRVHPEARQ